MEFFNSAIEVLQTLVVALGAGLGVWGAINLLEGYGNDNPGSTSTSVVRNTLLIFSICIILFIYDVVLHRFISSFTIDAVSYTHLDVYKRQGR